MADDNKCPKCGSEMPANAPQGVCPQCLMKLGLPTGAGPDGQNATPPGGFVPPRPEALAEQFAQLEIIELLGQGGMGAVYKARQKQLDRLVALKILPPEVGQDPAFAERFTREARSLAKLNHPNIVTVYDFGHTDQSLYYFIMEFVEGTDLRRVILGKELAPREALAIVPQICDALQYAHEEGIVHRDIKPENILLDKKGHVKIADFGLARLLDRPATALTLTQAGQRMGTPHYMAPEQIERPHEVDHRADIYSLGVVFYEMLTGELPLGRFDPPSQKVHVDVRLDEVVLHTLEKEPQRRYQQVSEVKTDVEAIGAAPIHDKPAVKTPGEPEKTASASEDQIEKAWQSLRIPAIGLVITALIDLLGMVGVLLLFGYFALGGQNAGLPGGIEWALIALLPGLIILSGARRMLCLKSHGLSVAAAILAVLPIHAGFMLGLPMGIWALIVLTRSEVQRAFDLAAQPGVFERKGLRLWPIILVTLILALLVLTPILIVRGCAIPASRSRGEDVVSAVYRPVTGSNGVSEPLTSEPNAPLYEKALGTTNGKIQVGPTLFEVQQVIRWDRKGKAIFGDGLGNEMMRQKYKTAGYSDQAPWMDIANIHLTPDASQYDVVELRVFDHSTRELLQIGESLALGYNIENSIVQLRSIGRLLPPTVDVWMRVMHTPENAPMWRLNPVEGSSASLGDISMLFREMRDGQWSYATKSGNSAQWRDPELSAVGQVQWTKRNDIHAPVCMAAFDFVNAPTHLVGTGELYQIAAIAKDGSRHVPDSPHFVAPHRGTTRVIEFDLSADQVSHFEIRPFLGRDRFYFDGLKLPKVSIQPYISAPPVKIPVGGKEADVTSDALFPAKLRVRVLKGKRATGVAHLGIHAWAKMTEEPFDNTDSMVTVIYELKGLATDKCTFNCFEADGRRIPIDGPHACTRSPEHSTVGFWRPKIPIQKIAHIEMSITDGK